jgi:hypothetical protein
VDLRTTLSKQDWGYRKHATHVEQETVIEKAPGKGAKKTKRNKNIATANYTAWHDVNTGLFMSTVHSQEDFDAYYEKSRTNSFSSNQRPTKASRLHPY